MSLNVYSLNYIKSINKKIQVATPSGIRNEDDIPLNSGEINYFINNIGDTGLENKGISGLKILNDISFIPLSEYLGYIYTGLFNQYEVLEYDADENNLPKIEKRIVENFNFEQLINKNDILNRVAIGYNHNLIILNDGTVTGWGSNSDGKLNIPSSIQEKTIGVYAGSDYSFAILNSGIITGWGSNSYNKLDVPLQIVNSGLALSCGKNHVLAILKNGQITGWGDNSFGQINIPPELQFNTKQILAANNVNFALLNNKEVLIWGNVHYKDLPPDSIQGKAKKIFGQYDHRLAITEDDIIFAWGSNDLRQTEIPFDPFSFSFITASAGVGHNLAISNEAFITGWGEGGNEDGVPYAQIPSELLSTGIIDLFCGANHSIVILHNGSITGWGDNSQGQISIPTNLNLFA
jgi:alpha-tubulin suppressor-like RCC1 family protein